MSGFLYYIPNRKNKPTHDELVSWGLGYAFSDPWPPRSAPHTSVDVLQNGPDEGGGVIVVDPSRVPAPKMRNRAGEQTWRKIPAPLLSDDAPEVWVGHWNDSPDAPTPADLVREQTVAGHLVKLGNGIEWLAPVARRYVEHDGSLAFVSALPSASTIEPETGQWVRGRAAPSLAHLWRLAERFNDTLSASFRAAGGEGATKQVTFDFAGEHDAAIQCLQANYAIGPVEADLLGLLDEEIAINVLLALVDWPTFVEWGKKNGFPGTSGDTNSARGGPDD